VYNNNKNNNKNIRFNVPWV